MTTPETKAFVAREVQGEVLVRAAANVLVDTKAGTVDVIFPDRRAALDWTTANGSDTHSWLVFVPDEGWQETTKEEVDRVLQWWLDHPEEWLTRGEFVGLKEFDPSSVG